MPRYFAFLRAINVGGHIVKMEVLRNNFEELGFTNVETFIASGNVIFETRSNSPRIIEAKIEKQLRASLGYEVTTFIRNDEELSAVVQFKPFSEPQLSSARSNCVGFMAESLGKEISTELMKLNSENEMFKLHDREIYWLSRVGQGESTFSNAVFERLTKGKSTFRGLNTLIRLAAKYDLS